MHKFHKLGTILASSFPTEDSGFVVLEQNQFNPLIMKEMGNFSLCLATFAVIRSSRSFYILCLRTLQVNIDDYICNYRWYPQMYKLVMKFLILSVISLQSSKSYEDEGV